MFGKPGSATAETKDAIESAARKSRVRINPRDTTSEPREYHFVLTVQKPVPSGGYIVADWDGCMTPKPGWTRRDAYQAIREEHVRVNPHLAKASVLFFSLEPNQL